MDDSDVLLQLLVPGSWIVATLLLVVIVGSSPLDFFVCNGENTGRGFDSPFSDGSHR